MFNKIINLTGLMLLAPLLVACGSIASAKSYSPAMQADSQPVTRTITVTGSGKAYLEPDIAYVNIGVHTENKDVAEAVASNNKQTQDVTEALLDAGVEEQDIQTKNFNIYPQQKYDPQGQPTGEIMYVVDNNVYVTVRDLDTIGELLSAAVKAGANSINGIQFDVSDNSEVLTEAREDAVEHAEAAAEDLAQATDVSLGEILSINTYGTNIPAPLYEGKGGGGIMLAQAAPPVPVSPGQLILTVDIVVVYNIE
jgi:hypothetical protein